MTTLAQDNERLLLDDIIRLREANGKLIDALIRLGGPFVVDPKHQGYCRQCEQVVGQYDGAILVAHKPGCPVALAVVAIIEAQAEPATAQVAA